MRMMRLMPLAAILLCGCAHTPLTGLAISRAVRDAEAQGWERVGDKLIPPDVHVPPLVEGQDINAWMQARQVREDVARQYGRDELSVALRVRPWLTRLAQLGDGALITGAAAAAGYGVERLVSADGDRTETYTIRADRGAVVQIGNRDGSGARGGGNVTGD